MAVLQISRQQASLALAYSTDPHLNIFRTRPWMLRDLLLEPRVRLLKAQTHSEALSAAPSSSSILSFLATTKACGIGVRRLSFKLCLTRPLAMETSRHS